MQEIRAYIKPFMLERLALTLMELPGFPGMSAMTVKGFGKERINGNQEYDPFIDKVRIETIVPDDMVDNIVQIILTVAHSGRAGDGKVYVAPINREFSIRSQSEVLN
ncbi:MAG: P-II family nitrogen regulator [Thiotrichales bacterium]|jgi:nitrogen regulatory protein P-II 1|nr:P-II family nitrogen regulator [Thiotrichales bacterium]